MCAIHTLLTGRHLQNKRRVTVRGAGGEHGTVDQPRRSTLLRWEHVMMGHLAGLEWKGKFAAANGR